ncbi:MAG: PilZ domain-containing protein [Lachnospiraceae bacterium]|nr:PilZ domain-containing protein [Lachnospiraceae bacterium]
MEEKRKSRRMELVSKLIIKRISGKKTDGASEVIIDVQNVSKTGVGFTCDTLLEIGTVYEVYLTIWTKEVIHAFVEIVRIAKEENAFSYGGIFIGMPEMDAARIEVYDTVSSNVK